MTSPDRLQKQALDYTEQGQTATASFVRTLGDNWASAIRMITGAGSGGGSSQPTPAELIDRSFDFSLQMLEAQRAFAHQLLEAGAPVARAIEQATDSVAERARETGGATGAGSPTGTPAGSSPGTPAGARTGRAGKRTTTGADGGTTTPS